MMRRGFLLNQSQTNSDNTNKKLGPLNDERSARVRTGWGEYGIDLDKDPWEDQSSSATTHEIPVHVGDESNKNNNNTAENFDNPYRNQLSGPYKTAGEPMNALGAYYSQHYYTTHLKMSDYYFTWNDKNPKSHLLLWTSIFVCPISGEIFMTGKWPGNEVVLGVKELPIKNTTATFESPANNDDACMTVDRSPTTGSIPTIDPVIVPTLEHPQHVRWHKKKKIAEHGAAAWAYDCFQLRHKECAIVHRPTTDSAPIIPKNHVHLTTYVGSEEPYFEDAAMYLVPSFVPETILVQIEERLIEIMKYDQSNYDGSKIDKMEVEEELAWCSPPEAS